MLLPGSQYGSNNFKYKFSVLIKPSKLTTGDILQEAPIILNPITNDFSLRNALENPSLKTQGLKTFANKKEQYNIYSSISNFLRNVIGSSADIFFIISTHKAINFPSNASFCCILWILICYILDSSTSKHFLISFGISFFEP